MFGFLQSLRCWRSTVPKLHRLVADNKVTSKKLRRCNIDHVDGDGRTIVYYAALFSSCSTMGLILKEVKRRGKSYLVDFPEVNGTTPLHMAADRGNKDIIRLLIEAGANIYQADKRNLYPWHYLATPANQELLQMLGGTQEEFAFANSESMLELYKQCPSGPEVMADAKKVEKEAEVEGKVVRLDSVVKKDEITGRTTIPVEDKATGVYQSEKGIAAQKRATNQCELESLVGRKAPDADRATKWIDVDGRATHGDEEEIAIQGNASCFDRENNCRDEDKSVLEKKDLVDIKSTVDVRPESAIDEVGTEIHFRVKECLNVEEGVIVRGQVEELVETNAAVHDLRVNAIDSEETVTYLSDKESMDVEEKVVAQDESEELVDRKAVIDVRPPENAIDAEGTTIDQGDNEHRMSEAMEEIDFREVGRHIVGRIVNALQPLAPYSFLLGVIAVNVVFFCLLRTLH